MPRTKTKAKLFSTGLVLMMPITVCECSVPPLPTSTMARSIVTIWRIGWLK